MSEVQTTKASRVGKMPVLVPKGVEVTINGQDVKVKGPKGEALRTFRPEVRVKQEEAELTVEIVPGFGKRGTQFQGMSRALLSNMVEGVHQGFKLAMDLRGVGYRANFKQGHLTMSLGLSHEVVQAVPDTVAVKIETVDIAGVKFPRVHLESYDKEALGQVAARMRAARPPEPYKGKGVRYTGEHVKLKAGKLARPAAKARKSWKRASKVATAVRVAFVKRSPAVGPVRA